MAKYTDGEIIAYLKTLKEGDVLIAAKNADDEYFLKGESYTVKSDGDGDLLVKDSCGCFNYVNIADDYKHEVKDYIDEGVFEIPTQQEKSDKPFYVDIAGYSTTYGEPTEVTIFADSAGLAKIKAIESESKKSQKLSKLYE